MMPPHRNTNSLQGLGLISYVDRGKHAVRCCGAREKEVMI